MPKRVKYEDEEEISLGMIFLGIGILLFIATLWLPAYTTPLLGTAGVFFFLWFCSE